MNSFEYIYIDKKSLKTFLLLHGTGGNERDLVPLGEELDSGANILSPRGKVLEYGMPRFFKRTGRGIFDREDLELRSEELADFVIKASDMYGFLQEGVVAIGYSNGANIALHVIATRPDVLSKAVLIRPTSAALPDSVATLNSVRVLVISGLLDSTMSSEDADILFWKLREQGASVEVKKIPASHGLTMQDLTCAKTWLKSV